jgi:hypothetical protein
MNKWETINDDSLLRDENAINFLISEFQQKSLNIIWFKDYFNWKLSNSNPAGIGYLTLGVTGNQIISTISLTCKRFLFNGNTYNGGEFGDAFCNPFFFNNIKDYSPTTLLDNSIEHFNYFNKSIFGRAALETTNRAINDKLEILYGTPNNNALPSWTKYLGHFNFTNHQIYIYTKKNFHFYYKRFRLPIEFEKLSVYFDLALTNLFYIINKSFNKKLELLNIIPTKTELNILWNETKKLEGFQLIRDYDYWKHRYFNHPLNKYLIYKIQYDNKFIGIIVGCLQNNLLDCKDLYILEWMIDTKFPIKKILNTLIYNLRNQNIIKYETYINDFSKEIKCFKSNNFKKSNKIDITFYKNSLVNELTLDPKNFIFYLGNTDSY